MPAPISVSTSAATGARRPISRSTKSTPSAISSARRVELIASSRSARSSVACPVTWLATGVVIGAVDGALDVGLDRIDHRPLRARDGGDDHRRVRARAQRRACGRRGSQADMTRVSARRLSATHELGSLPVELRPRPFEQDRHEHRGAELACARDPRRARTPSPGRW